MSVYSGPNINNDGVVFAYDMSNLDKSWKGAPTTNLNTEQSLTGMSGISLTFVGIENGWKKYGMSGTWASGTYPFSLNISATTLSGTVAYSAQTTMKTNVISKFLTFGGLNYVNDGSMVNSGVSTVTSIGNDTDGFGIVLSKREGFIYSAGFANPTTSQPGYINSRPTADGVSFNSSTDFVWIKNIQVEQGTFCTPWVSTARSNTQALLDLTNTNTLTATSLTYASDNTFSFNGTSNYITSNFATTAGQAVTYAGWLYSTETTATYKNFVDSASQNPMIWWNTSGQIEFDAALYTTTPVYRNQWVYVVLSKPAGSSAASYYVNGNLVGTGTAYSTAASTPTWFNRAASQTWKGNCNTIQVYNRALSATEVKQNFNALRSRYGI